jgi:exopolyphosphatase/pppGpp-phosphohydrolase
MVEPGGPALLNRRVDLILPTATSAVRDAANGPAFVD